LLARHGHTYSRQQLWNFKTGNRRVPEHVELILKNEQKARKAVGRVVISTKSFGESVCEN
jgi:hypothetical protein